MYVWLCVCMRDTDFMYVRRVSVYMCIILYLCASVVCVCVCVCVSVCLSVCLSDERTRMSNGQYFARCNFILYTCFLREGFTAVSLCLLIVQLFILMHFLFSYFFLCSLYLHNIKENYNLMSIDLSLISLF